MIRHLFVPGLLGPLPGPEREHRGSWPRLETVLARADRLVEPRGYTAGLCALFGIEAPAGADLPTAALAFLADTGEPPAGFVLHADPVQLIADRDRLLAFDLDDDPLDVAEIAALVDAFNTHYRGDGLRLYGSPAGRIYLYCDRAPAIRTHPLSSVVGRSLDRFLPDGDERRRWHGLLNETQMLCHALELNREREAGGRPAPGGLWFSGGGVLPPAGQGPVGVLSGDCPVARGLLMLRPGTGSDELIVDQAPLRSVMRADPDAWRRAITAIEDRMGDVVRDAEALHLHPGNGALYRWRAGAARRWWRRRRPLYAYLDRAPGTAPGERREGV